MPLEFSARALSAPVDDEEYDSKAQRYPSGVSSRPETFGIRGVSVFGGQTKYKRRPWNDGQRPEDLHSLFLLPFLWVSLEACSDRHVIETFLHFFYPTLPQP